MSAERPASPDIELLRARLQAALGDRYVLEGVLGRGANGTVFAARDPKHQRRVALKVLHPELTAGVGTERFLREIRIAARLSHPHIVPLHDSGEAGGLLYYVMTLMEGESLQALVDREGPLPVDRAVRIVRQVAEALGHAHQAGVVHRDVKPGNILISGDHAFLTDFGVARAAADAWGLLTVTGTAVGTPAYMSPEQISGDAGIDARSDVFSLGCVLYELLAGERPFRGRPAAALAARFVRVPPLADLRPEVSPAVAAAVQRALAADPADRFGSASGFAEALDGRAPVRRVPWAAVGAVALLGATMFALGRLPGTRADLSDRAGSLVVLPFQDATQTPDDARVLADLADELTRQLNRWDSIRAVPQVALAGVTFDLGLAGPVLQRLEDGFRTTRALGVETLVALTGRVRGDSVVVTATSFDAASRRQVGPALESRGSVHEPIRVAAGIVHQVLGLTGPVEEVENLRRRSSNPRALLRHDEGRRAMERWRLAEAERAFREAVALDSTFALVHHHLALVLYWQGSEGTPGLARLGPEAVRLSRAALRHADDLSTREREHVVAFNRFLEGDFQEAREGYAALLARDSTDVYAWLLAGIVEYRDPWLAERPDGTLRPRSDLDRAVRAFVETTRLNPGFHLGYGHLFDITREVLSSAVDGALQGFERPRMELVPLWEARSDPERLEAFALVYEDSLFWLDGPTFRARSPEGLTEGAGRLLEGSLRTLRRWAAFAPEEHRPHSELATWTARQLEILHPPQPPERLDSLARVALGHTERALALAPDTSDADLVRLANLLLAAGESSRAHASIASVLERSIPGDLLPRAAQNTALFVGDVDTARELLERGGVRRMYWENPETGRLLGDGGVGGLVRRLALLGAMGAFDELPAAFDELEAALDAPSDGRMPVQRLRSQYGPAVAPALAAHPERLPAWRAGTDLTGPLWDAIDPSTSDRPASLRAALAEEDAEVSEAVRSYLLGVAALEVGDPRLAARLLARMDSIPMALDAPDMGWGLKGLALYRRAQALDSAGDRTRVVELLRRFLETRAEGAPFQERARALMVELTASSHGGRR